MFVALLFAILIGLSLNELRLFLKMFDVPRSVYYRFKPVAPLCHLNSLWLTLAKLCFAIWWEHQIWIPCSWFKMVSLNKVWPVLFTSSCCFKSFKKIAVEITPLRCINLENPYLIEKHKLIDCLSPSLRAREQGNWCPPHCARESRETVTKLSSFLSASTMQQPKVEFLLYVKEVLSIFMEWVIVHIRIRPKKINMFTHLIVQHIIEICILYF